MSNLKKRAIAGVTALVLAASLSACDTDDDPNGTNGETNDTEVATTTSTPVPATTDPVMTTTTQAP